MSHSSDLSLEEAIGQCLCPAINRYKSEELEEILREVPLGCVFVTPDTEAALRERIELVQRKSAAPVLVAADFERGANAILDTGIKFPWAMAAGAAGSAELIRTMGEATAEQGRAIGIHWTFAPVADLSFHFESQTVCTRALGDSVEEAVRLLPYWIEGLQAGGLMAGTAKHFPGDGVDARDQHLCTSVNSMPMEQWWETFGKVWKAVIGAGVWSIMPGHISLPAYEGFEMDPEEALPATLSRRLQVDLLRGELGFDGLLVSDAAPMIGLTSRCPEAELAVENIRTGSDVYLFADPREDYHRLLKAVKEGRLSEERVREAAGRVLAMKKKLGVAESDASGPVPSERMEVFSQAATRMARESVTLLRRPPSFPLQLKHGAKVLTVTLRYDNPARRPDDLHAFDATLRERGFEVDHLLNPKHGEIRKAYPEYDHVFVNFFLTMHMYMGTVRPTDHTIFVFWRAFYADCKHVSFSTFGNPYILWDQPHLPGLLATFSPEEVSQRAAVEAWLGEIEPKTDPHIQLPQVKVAPIDHPALSQ